MSQVLNDALMKAIVRHGINAHGIQGSTTPAGRGTPANTTTTASGDGNANNAGDQSKKDEDENEDDKDDTPAVKKLKAEAASRRREARKATEERDAALKKIQEFEDKEKTALELAQSQKADADKKLAELAAKDKQRTIELEFLKKSKVDWHNAEAALKLLDMSEIEVEDDGTVKGMAKAVDTLAKDYPFLVKGKSTDSGNNGAGTGATEKKDDGTPSGNNPGGANNGDPKVADRAALEKKYPQIARGVPISQ